MGSWAYCSGKTPGYPTIECGQSFDRPTFVEALKGFQECPRCVKRRALDSSDLELAATDILERLDALEKKFSDPIGWRSPDDKLFMTDQVGFTVENVPPGWTAITR